MARSTVSARCELDVQRQGVPGEHRHPHAGAGDPQVGDAEDLAALVAELLLLVGLERAVVDQRAGHRQHVVGDRADVLDRIGEAHGGPVVGEFRGLVDDGLDLQVELLHAGQPAAGHRLVGAGDHPDELGLGVQRLQHGHRGHRGAVRVRDDALAHLGERLRVDLADDERDVGVAPPGGAVVDDGDAGLGEPRRLRARGGRPGGEQRDVQAGRVGGGGVLDRDLASLRTTAPGQGAAGGAGGGEEPQLGEREVALGEEPPHDAAHLAGGADDADPQAVPAAVPTEQPAHRPVPP